MQISIINGSARTKGAAATILKECQRYLQEHYQTSVDYIDPTSTEMCFCKGCIACYRTGQYIIKDDDIDVLANKVKPTDGGLIYCYRYFHTDHGNHPPAFFMP